MNQNDETHRYAELPTPNLPRGGFPDLFTAEQMQDFADRTHTLRTRATPFEAIETLLNQAMDQAVSNGANSVSMPDEVVEVAYWLVHPTWKQPMKKPKVVLEMPDGDDRVATVRFSELKGDTLHLCIAVT